MNLGEASDVHTVLEAAFVDATPAALQQALPAAVRLAGRTGHAMNSSGRHYVSAATLQAWRPPAPVPATTVPAAAVNAAFGRLTGSVAEEVWRLAAEDTPVGHAARRELLTAALGATQATAAASADAPRG